MNLVKKDQMCVKGKHPWICCGISGMKRNENGKNAGPRDCGDTEGHFNQNEDILAQSWKRGHRTKPNDNRRFHVSRVLKSAH